MGYSLGIDIGTTYSSAAVSREGRSEVLSLGTDRPTVPTVVLLRSDGTVLVGEAAERRALTEPTRVAREFKRRMGDPTPFIVGGTPYGVEALTAHVIKWVLALATEREGAAPDRVLLTHPAAWGTYKLDLLGQAAVLADSPPFEFLSEPEAAALRYAQEGRVEAGDVVAVYDFGGGTLDVALVRCMAADQFELVGQPAGMERLGGIDFDQAVFAHVNDAVDGMLTEVDPSDPQARAALARVRTDCRLAKEALSSDTDAVVPVILPDLQTEIRITRPEFESMIRPRIAETIDTLDRTVRSAGMQMTDAAAVLLVGGTSRIPLIREMVHTETGLPVTLDSHPKTTICLGAALYASLAGDAVPPLLVPSDEPSPGLLTAVVPAAVEKTTPDQPAPVPPSVSEMPAPDPVDIDASQSGRRVPVWMVGAVAAAVLAIIATIWFLRSGSDDPGVAGATLVSTTTTLPSVTVAAGALSDPTTTTSEAPVSSVPDSTTTTARTAAAGYLRVTDATSTLSVEVPEDWVEVDRDGLFLFDTPSPHVSASPNLLGYLDTWTTPGITVAVVDPIYIENTWLLNQAMASAFGYADSCVDGGGEQYSGGGLTGDTWIWLDCDGTGNMLITVAVTDDGDFFYLVVAQVTDDEHLIALDQALASIEFTPSTSG
jgi:molecular chaperone DnaK